ncbi:hypothetical protein D3C78_798280 [compost metagenome]
MTKGVFQSDILMLGLKDTDNLVHAVVPKGLELDVLFFWSYLCSVGCCSRYLFQYVPKRPKFLLIDDEKVT